MTIEELQKKYDKLLNLARRVRGHQKEYFKYRVKSDLELSKRWERELDKEIEDEVKARKSNQTPLF